MYFALRMSEQEKKVPSPIIEHLRGLPSRPEFLILYIFLLVFLGILLSRSGEEPEDAITPQILPAAEVDDTVKERLPMPEGDAVLGTDMTGDYHNDTLPPEASEEEEISTLSDTSLSEDTPEDEADSEEHIADDPVVSDDTPESADPKTPERYTTTVTVNKGDVFSRLLGKAGVDALTTVKAGKALEKAFDPRSLQIGQTLSFTFLEQKQHDPLLVELRIETSDSYIILTKDDKGDFSSSIEEKALERQIVKAEGVINNSLYKLADDLHIPANIMAAVVNAYSFDVDFQRDIHKGTRFRVLYEVYYDASGTRVRTGHLLYAELDVQGEEIAVYRFSPSKGGADGDDADFFKQDGRTTRRSFLKTPIDGAIISSHFGLRKHPIHGFTRLHKGMDFAAPRGTPVYAAGDGIIQQIGKNGGYGNYIRIRHNKNYDTAYAHLNRFAKGMKRYRRVKQGQVIGYVGSTGASTGPHLHYEFLINGKQVNPVKVDIPSGVRLSGETLERFETYKNEMKALLEKQPS